MLLSSYGRGKPESRFTRGCDQVAGRGLRLHGRVFAKYVHVCRTVVFSHHPSDNSGSSRSVGTLPGTQRMWRRLQIHRLLEFKFCVELCFSFVLSPFCRKCVSACCSHFARNQLCARNVYAFICGIIVKRFVSGGRNMIVVL